MPEYFKVRCPVCDWGGMSDQAEGGHPLADTGDYSELICPVCDNIGHVVNLIAED